VTSPAHHGSRLLDVVDERRYAKSDGDVGAADGKPCSKVFAVVSRAVRRLGRSSRIMKASVRQQIGPGTVGTYATVNA
jgi:hypothetical protein